MLGEAWVSALLTGLADATGFDPCGRDGYVGTSAGAIVAAALVAGVDPRTRLGALPTQPPVDLDPPTRPAMARAAGAAAGALVAPLASLGLRLASPGGALARRAALMRVPRGRRSLAGLGRQLDRLGARWDGRLSVAAVELATGRRTMFGDTGAPATSVGRAVEASCSIPGVFCPVEVDGRTFVDGGVWSPTNLDRAPARRGTRVLCLNPTGSLPATASFPFGMVGAVSRALAAAERLALRRRGAQVALVSPNEATAAAVGGQFMDQGRRADVIAAGVAQGWALAGGVGG